MNKVEIPSILTGAPTRPAFVSIDAPLCQAGFPYRYCEAEDFYFASPRPAESLLQNFYNGHGALITRETLRDAHQQYADGERTFVDHVSAIICAARDGGRWLDYGCGAGVLLNRNRKRFEPHGVEISAAARAFITSEIGIPTKGALSDFDGDFDLITAIDVLEHVPDPASLLREFHARLSPEGCVVLRLPIIDGIRFDRSHPERWKWVMAPYHLQMFSIRALMLLAGRCGFTAEIKDDHLIHCDREGVYQRFPIVRATRLGRIALHYGYGPLALTLRRRYRADCAFAILRRD